jgi:mRNA interferase MazF
MSGEAEVRRGDVFLVNLDPVVGSEIGKTRPAVVVQNDIGNRHSSTVIVIAITSYSPRKATFPICIQVEQGNGGLKQRSIANTSQMRTVDKARLVTPALGRLAPETMQAIDASMRISLALD